MNVYWNSLGRFNLLFQCQKRRDIFGQTLQHKEKSCNKEIPKYWQHRDLSHLSTLAQHLSQLQQQNCALTWCKTEQFWHFPTVASAAMATFFDRVSRGIMVNSASKHTLLCIKEIHTYVTVGILQHRTGFKTISHIRVPHVDKGPKQDPNKGFNRMPDSR